MKLTDIIIFALIGAIAWTMLTTFKEDERRRQHNPDQEAIAFLMETYGMDQAGAEAIARGRD
ncbi:hypothetical protein DENIS_3939 [Desulfonema ishimotonii]|uniref:Uncharacterized protein n=1 Tax=Desulfonema ishimotonii TaxID=45657 RepID=A0A401G160_9BACT|nr:hypothetical protein [Desulfonema ishimotonii]GBC62954.1 hypothetical protein DENIS_3939 [Desulfonema ishimotonii]